MFTPEMLKNDEDPIAFANRIWMMMQIPKIF